MSGHVGITHYSDPRAVQIAGKYLDDGDPEDKTPHSAVHGDINILTETVMDAQKLMNRWPEIMKAIHNTVSEILAASEGT